MTENQQTALEFEEDGETGEPYLSTPDFDAEQVSESAFDNDKDTE